MTAPDSLQQNVISWFKGVGAEVPDEQNLIELEPIAINYKDLEIYLGPSLSADNQDGLEIGAIVGLNIADSDEDSDLDEYPELRDQLRNACTPGIAIDVTVSEGVDIWVVMQLNVISTPEEISESLVRYIDTALQCRDLVERAINPPTIIEPDLNRSAIDEIRELVGVDEIVRKVEELKASYELSLLRRNEGLKADFDIPHLVFTGNPGTGKTTVANKIGLLFKEIGLLPSGHLVDARRKDLVASYVGQTAPKTERVIAKAIGGILFIDEAYSLAEGWGDGRQSFGDECITTLLTQMENRKGEFVVIVAGYPEKMNYFLDSNPGLRSRFDQTWNFRDYSDDELLQILKIRAVKEDYVVSPECDPVLLEMFSSMERNSHFGNARTARNVLQAMRRKLAVRVVSKKLIDRESLMTLLPEDIEPPVSLVKRRTIGFTGNPGMGGYL